MTLLSNVLAWTLLHSLWQGALVALLLFVVLCVARSATVRSVAACIALLIIVAAFAVTFIYLSRSPPAIVESRLPPNPMPGGTFSLEALPTPIGSLFDIAMHWLTPLWMFGVLLFQARATLSWIAAQRLRRRGACLPADPWLRRLAQLATRMSVARPVILLETCLCRAPVVIGHLRPVILVPVGLLTGMPPGQVESILLHELAHIRRFDYLTNLLQTLIEGFLFYHPVVWWISGVIRSERENCCDDLAVAVTGSGRQYAAALAALEQNCHAACDAALAANGGNVVKRIRRLLYPLERPRVLLSPVVAASVIAIAAACFSFAWQEAPVAPPAAPLPPRATSAPRAPAASAAREPVAPAAPAAREPVAPVALLPPGPPPAPRGPGNPNWRQWLNQDVAQIIGADERIRFPANTTAWRKWLQEDVAYIIRVDERAAFLALTTDPERERFIAQFWERRDPTPGTPRNEIKDEHYRRIAYTNDHFGADMPGWKTDRGRAYIVYGPPDQMESHPAGATPPSESWRYRYIQGIGTDVILQFVDKVSNGHYVMTSDPVKQ